MTCRNRHDRNRLPGRGASIRICLFCLAMLTLNACAMLDFGKSRLPPGASRGSAGQRSVLYGPSEPSTYSVVDTARSVVGTPYRWGGDTPREGFDCSGLVQWVYARHGVNLPRPSWEQINTGIPVGRGDLREGDLVFFKIVRGNSYHVGIYTGRGTFVHSPKSGSRVRESSLSETYWRSHYIGARRVAEPLRAHR